MVSTRPQAVNWVTALYRALALIELSGSTQWFHHVRTFGLDVVYHRLTRREVTIILSLPWVVRLVFTLSSVRAQVHHDPLVTKTGFELSSQHLRLAFRHPVLGKVKGRTFYWARYWRDLFGTKAGDPYVKRVLAMEHYRYYAREGHVLEIREVEAEAILYGQGIRGSWWFPLAMEREWVEVRLSHPITTRLGVIQRKVYDRPGLRHIQRPLDIFRHDLAKMGLGEVEA